jgi:hypothetical protein
MRGSERGRTCTLTRARVARATSPAEERERWSEADYVVAYVYIYGLAGDSAGQVA